MPCSNDLVSILIRRKDLGYVKKVLKAYYVTVEEPPQADTEHTEDLLRAAARHEGY